MHPTNEFGHDRAGADRGDPDPGLVRLEGNGAALVLPAMAALITGDFEGKDRNVAYAVLGGVAGAGIGPTGTVAPDDEGVPPEAVAPATA